MSLKVLFLSFFAIDALVCQAMGDESGKMPGTSGKVIVEKQTKKPFTEAWRKIYSERQLKYQQKWYLAEKQPVDGSFQARNYEKQWIATSWESCRTLPLAYSFGYIDLYFYITGVNYQKQKFNQTYPTIVVANGRVRTTPKARKAKNRNSKPSPVPTPAPCPIRYVHHFHVPIPLEKYPPIPLGKTIKTFKRRETLFYVREYRTNATMSPNEAGKACMEEAKQLTTDLANNDKKHLENFILCAQYDRGEIDKSDSRKEVWMQGV